MERWLSLTVLDPSPSPKARVHISIPKRAVKLAVRRNRLKRVLREAVRQDPFFGKKGVYRLKVNGWPALANVRAARAALEALHG
jgi:hypothetical protein